MSAAARVSIVICTCDKPERLVLALHSLVRQAAGEGHRIETIVVADGCTRSLDAAIGPALDLGLVVRVIDTPRIGQSAARNLGAAQSRGSLLLFMDDDVLLSPDYVATCCALLDRHPSAVVRAPVFLLRYLAAFRDPERGIPYEGDPERFRGRALDAERISRAMILDDWPSIAARCRHQNRFERLVSATLRSAAPAYPWLGYSGSGVALHREVFLRSGGYDEGFGLRWGAESIELGYRLWRAGVQFIEADGIYSAHMDHPRGESMGTFDESFEMFFVKHGDAAIRAVQALIIGADRRPAPPSRASSGRAPAAWS